MAGASNSAVRNVKVGKDDEIRLDWTLNVSHAGPTKIKVVAQTNEESDAAEMTFPVLVHGVEKFLAQSGVIRNDGTQTVTLDIPAQRRKGATRLDVQLQPSLAATVIDALPYLEDYPYGCLEQTLSRFVADGSDRAGIKKRRHQSGRFGQTGGGIGGAAGQYPPAASLRKQRLHLSEGRSRRPANVRTCQPPLLPDRQARSRAHLRFRCPQANDRRRLAAIGETAKTRWRLWMVGGKHRVR